MENKTSSAPVQRPVVQLSKSYRAIPTCFDFNHGGNDGPYALFSIGDKNMRIPVHMSADELQSFISSGVCLLTISINPPNVEITGPASGSGASSR